MAQENKFGKSHFEAFGCFKLEEHDQDYLGVAKQRLGESPEIKIQTLVSFKEKLKNEHQTLHERRVCWSDENWDSYLVMYLRANNFDVEWTIHE